MVHHRPIDSGVKLTTGSRLADTYEMVNDPCSDSIISWSQNGDSFVVWKPQEFAADFLPKLLLCPDISAFARMLHRFGFRRVCYERWEFANVYFLRGKPELIHNIFYPGRAEARFAAEIFKRISRNQRRKTKKATKALVDQLQSLQM